MIGDDTGDNISTRNNEYCELTAIYWAWKNSTADEYVGLMHYRRFLDFEGAFDSEKAEVFVGEFDINRYVNHASEIVSSTSADIFVPKPFKMTQTVWDNYCTGHQEQDLCAVREILKDGSPAIFEAFEETLASKEIYLGNIFLMKRNLFNEYCEWLFDVLEKLEKLKLNREYYSPYQSRYLGFIAERLLTVYVNYLHRKQPELRIEHRHILNISNAIAYPYRLSKDFNTEESVNIVFAADRAYVPHSAAMIHSLLQSKTENAEYNLFFLATDVDAKARELLQLIVSRFDRSNLFFINVGEYFEKSYKSPTRTPSNATYNRFFIFDLFPHLDRILYLDCDTIVLECVEELFNTPMGNALLAGVPDVIMTRTLNIQVTTKDPNFPDLYNYQRSELGLSDVQINNYVNAGVLLFNLKRIDAKKCSRELKEKGLKGKCLFRDQDILNSYFKEEMVVLPSRYNVFNTFSDGYSKVPRRNYDSAMAAKKNPAIVHFAAEGFKPWNNQSVPFADLYWKHLLCTPFYSEVVSKLVRTEIRESSKVDVGRRIYRIGEYIYDRVPATRPILSRIDFILKSIAKRT